MLHSFETQRLVFRPLILSDLNYLIQLDSDPEVRAFFPGGALSKEQIQKNLKKKIDDWEKLGFSDFAMFEKSTQEFVGRAGFAPYGKDEVEMGYVFLKQHWGKGYATEAAAGLLQWAKANMRAPRIIAFAPVNHTASCKVLEKVGMTFFKKGLYSGQHDAQCSGVECNFYEYINYKTI